MVGQSSGLKARLLLSPRRARRVLPLTLLFCCFSCSPNNPSSRPKHHSFTVTRNGEIRFCLPHKPGACPQRLKADLWCALNVWAEAQTYRVVVGSLYGQEHRSRSLRFGRDDRSVVRKEKRVSCGVTPSNDLCLNEVQGMTKRNQRVSVTLRPPIREAAVLPNLLIP